VSDADQRHRLSYCEYDERAAAELGRLVDRFREFVLR
jgi:hypothetical protein